MPPKIRFRREDVINAAFELVEEGGFNQMSTQNVAKRLNSSVQPIYSHMNSIENLRREVAIQANEIYVEYIFKEYTKRKFLDPWIGEVFFAQDHANLYYALFVDRNKYEEISMEISRRTFKIIQSDQELEGLDPLLIHSFYRHMQIYIYGLAIMQCNDYWKDGTRSGIIRVITETGEILLAATKSGQILQRDKWFQQE